MKQKSFKLRPTTLIQYQSLCANGNRSSTDPTATVMTITVTGTGFAKPRKK